MTKSEYIDSDWITVSYKKKNSSIKYINKSNINIENKYDDVLSPIIVTKEYGLRIQQARMLLNISQRELAYKLNIHINIINDYENGIGIKHNNIINKINNFLNITF
jgi:ribosome-binding protein aMBF1 (putative translation factor)